MKPVLCRPTATPLAKNLTRKHLLLTFVLLLALSHVVPIVFVRSDHHFTKRSGDMVYTSVLD